jgi:hypothetical protein
LIDYHGSKSQQNYIWCHGSQPQHLVKFNWSLWVFLNFHLDFLVIIKLTDGQFDILINNIILKKLGSSWISCAREYVTPPFLDDSYGGLQWPKTTTIDVVGIISMDTPSLGVVCSLVTSCLASSTFPLFSLSLSSIFSLGHLNFQTSPSIYFSFVFGLCFFITIYFIWNNL